MHVWSQQHLLAKPVHRRTYQRSAVATVDPGKLQIERSVSRGKVNLLDVASPANNQDCWAGCGMIWFFRSAMGPKDMQPAFRPNPQEKENQQRANRSRHVVQVVLYIAASGPSAPKNFEALNIFELHPPILPSPR